jgi:hypothetical protein
MNQNEEEVEFTKFQLILGAVAILCVVFWGALGYAIFGVLR